MSADEKMREELGALLDGELPVEREAELRARIEADPELAREFEALRRTVAAVRELGRERAPAALRERLARPRPAPIVWPRWWLASAAVLLVAVGAALLAQLGDPTPKQSEYGYEATLPDEEAPPVADEDEARDAGERIGALQPTKAEERAEPSRALRAVEDDAPGVAERKLGTEEGGRPQRPQDSALAEAEALGRDDAPPAEPAPEADAPPVEQPAGKETARRRGTNTRGREALSLLAREGRLARDRRRDYLAALASLDAKGIVNHVAALPEVRLRAPAPTTPANETKKAKADEAAEAAEAPLAAKAKPAPAPLEVRMADRAEAEALGRVLRAGYARPAKASGRGASTSLERRGAGFLEVVVELTERDKRKVRNWLVLLDATRPPGAPAAFIQRRDAGGDAGDDRGAEAYADAEAKAKRERVRIRIRFAD